MWKPIRFSSIYKYFSIIPTRRGGVPKAPEETTVGTQFEVSLRSFPALFRVRLDITSGLCTFHRGAPQLRRLVSILAVSSLVLAHLGTAALLLQASMFPVVPGPHPVAVGLQSSGTKDLSTTCILERRFVPLVKEITLLPALIADSPTQRPWFHSAILPLPPDDVSPSDPSSPQTAARAPPSAS